MAMRISKRHLAFLERLAEREYPRESCAILLGRHSGEVSVAVRCANVHPEPQRRYEIDPRDLIRLQRTAWSCGLEIVGFHHSHPEHEAEPSDTDLEMAFWTGCVYVITAVQGGRVTETCGYLLEAGEAAERRCFNEVALNVGDS